jgi:DNA mismatch endonuclease, patch repair protein
VSAKRRARKRTDVLTPEQRSHCMSQIKGRNTKPELLLRGVLWKIGARYRLKSKLDGKPDLVFPGARVAVFVDGCQWHCCPKHFVRPKSNTEFWDRKFDTNRRRDVTVNGLLKARGWTVLRFWEHEVGAGCESVAASILQAVQAAKPSYKRRSHKLGNAR